MNLLLFTLFVFTTATSVYTLLSDEQEERIDNLAWLYAQFSLTFDTDELPLDNYFQTNEEQFNLFKEVEDFFNDNNLQRYFLEINVNELVPILENKIKQYQSIIINADKTPMAFKAFYILFNLFKQQNSLYGPGITKYRKLWNNFSDTIVKQFCVNVNIHSDEDIIVALRNFKINERFPEKQSKKLETDEKRYFTLFTKFNEKLKGNTERKPQAWTYHHIIPSNTLTQFYRYYFELLSFKSEKIQKTHKFDWFKIMEFNTQKSFLVQASVFWSNKLNSKGAALPVNQLNKRKTNNQQVDFVRTWYRWPPGLVFYGPKQSQDMMIQKVILKKMHFISLVGLILINSNSSTMKF